MSEREKEMKTNEIFRKTLKFVWLKLGLGMVITVVSLILLGVIAGIAALFGSGEITILAGFIWFCMTLGVYVFAMRYVGYMIKAAHVAVVSQAVTTGQLPDNMFEAGKQMVTERFGATNTYFVLDRLISGAVSQLQKTVGKLENVFGGIPGVSTIIDFMQTFIGIALGYIDECCLGYTFIKKEDSAWKAGCDGVVIYFQNVKHLLKSAAVTTLMVMGLTFLAWLIPFAIIGGIFYAADGSMLIAAILCVVIAATLKAAFIDSYVMVRTMKAYMEVAPSTEITFDLYGKLCKLSGKFKELFNKSQQNAAA